MICVTLPASTGGSLTNLEKTWKPGAQTLTFLALMPFSASASCSALRIDLFAGGFLRAFEAERLDGKILETQTAGFVDFKLRQLEAARPKIHRQK